MMKYKAEEPAGHLSTLFLLIFESGKLGGDGVPIAKQFVVLLLNP